MNAFANGISMDQWAAQNTVLHRLDPRVKLVVTLGFIIVVMSFPPYECAALLPFIFFPLSIALVGHIPLGALFMRVLIVSPFALFIGMFNPFFDTAPQVYFDNPLFSLSISGGWLSFFSIMLRFALTVSTALLLVASTGFNTLCAALESLGTPKVFVVQLLFLYRYLFVLTAEAQTMLRARNARSFGQRGQDIRVYSQMLGQLFLRTLDRAGRIHSAMTCRGFSGSMPPSRCLALRGFDCAYTLFWLLFFLLARFVNLPLLLGTCLHSRLFS